MLRHAIVNKNNEVVNVILWDGINDWSPPQDHIAIHDKTELCNIGDLYDSTSKKFIKPDLR